MPDFYDMHVALCREKRTPKRTPMCDAAWPIVTLAQSALALVAGWPTRAPGEHARKLTKLETEFTLFTEDRTILPPIVTCSLHLFPLQ